MPRLILHDGTVFEGLPLGASGETIGEVVFNTGMTGYQEILTDPSYAGQLVLFTYPLIGNYGVNHEDFQSERIQAVGAIVFEACKSPSNWRNRQTLDGYLKQHGIVGIQGIDTRAITKQLRSAGVAMGMITDQPVEKALQTLRSATPYDEIDFVEKVSTPKAFSWGPDGKEPIEPRDPTRYRVVVMDLGVKFDILRQLVVLGCECVVVPASATADQILAYEPDGVLVSPGPGDPARLERPVEAVRRLLGKKPIFGICLGNQVLCRALGGSTFKLKFGHRGSNHPVLDLRTGKVTITSQNHGYAVDPETLKGTGATVTQINVNDETVEGIHYPDAMASSIQYHPEAAPGPRDSRHLFEAFLKQMEATQ